MSQLPFLRAVLGAQNPEEASEWHESGFACLVRHSGPLRWDWRVARIERDGMIETFEVIAHGRSLSQGFARLQVRRAIELYR
jgi:hypothetical protein